MTDVHATLAPSSAGQWVHCPASVRLQQQYPEPDGDNEAADEGTVAHAQLARMVKGDIFPDLTGINTPVSGYTGEMKQMLPPIAKAIRDWTAADASVWKGKRYVETWIDIPGIHAGCGGTPDFAALNHETRTARIDDLKWGYGIVQDYENWQLIAYAAGVSDLIEHELASWSFELWIHQPRVWHREGTSRVWKLTYPQLAGYIRQLRGAAEEAMGNNPQANPGPYCKHCTARHACKALRAAGLAAYEQASDATPLDLPPMALGRELAILSRAEELLESRLSGLRAQVEALLRRGEAVPGWAMEHKPGAKAWTKPVAEVLALGSALGVSLAKLPEPITPTQATNLGIPVELIDAYAARKPAAAKLVQVTLADAAKAFGGNKE